MRRRRPRDFAPLNPGYQAPGYQAATPPASARLLPMLDGTTRIVAK